MTTPTLVRQLRCAKREFAFRLRTYPRWVAQGRMSQATADDEITAMDAICTTLAALVEQEGNRGQRELFATEGDTP